MSEAEAAVDAPNDSGCKVATPPVAEEQHLLDAAPWLGERRSPSSFSQMLPMEAQPTGLTAVTGDVSPKKRLEDEPLPGRLGACTNLACVCASEFQVSAASDERPMADDVVLQASDATGLLCNANEPHSPSALAAWKQVREFKIVVPKHGRKLGVRYDDSDGKTLVIKCLEPGGFYETVMKHPSEKWAMIEDRIVEVNGVRGKSELLEEQCRNSEVLCLTLQRPLQMGNLFCLNEDATVRVHAYDLFGHDRGFLSCMARSLNAHTTRYGLFHTGVEVFGWEWFFGASPDGSFHGVNSMEPMQHPVHRHRVSVALGKSSLSPADFEELMPLIRMKWPSWSYRSTSRNCHSFSDFFCKILGFSAAPKFGLFGCGDESLAPGRSVKSDSRTVRGCGCCVVVRGQEASRTVSQDCTPKADEYGGSPAELRFGSADR
ncbi:unnamed protein product [Effrenium voratum]|uniref:PPPDE domain-containing protein n=1 Tax=Effrenium voratum TaxID=2562239 RepID=A0AA36JB24_9DINO|nr:unnamed protein product [Effrenium voratum]